MTPFFRSQRSPRTAPWHPMQPGSLILPGRILHGRSYSSPYSSPHMLMTPFVSSQTQPPYSLLKTKRVGPGRGADLHAGGRHRHRIFSTFMVGNERNGTLMVGNGYEVTVSHSEMERVGRAPRGQTCMRGRGLSSASSAPPYGAPYGGGWVFIAQLRVRPTRDRARIDARTRRPPPMPPGGAFSSRMPRGGRAGGRALRSAVRGGSDRRLGLLYTAVICASNRLQTVLNQHQACSQALQPAPNCSEPEPPCSEPI
jgi:hypothetical protein